MADEKMIPPSLVQWGCLAILLGVIALTVAGGIWLFTRAPGVPTDARPTATVYTITPSPPSAAPPALTPTPSSPNSIGIGARVKVSGTGNAGLSMRAAPSTTAERIDIAQEGEVLLVVGGPKEADGYRWWFVRDELNTQREGWVAADYLVPAQ
ncbi:MAG TPA: SH3 domain-containing protein [Chloroflexi bacterium]|nr:SH3 domain-containing protein [Chloroflexota bacterium]